MSEALDYRASGVDIDVGDAAKRGLKAIVESTMTSGVRGSFGAFGGMFRVPTDVAKPVLVSSADSVGTKIKVAVEANRHDTVGHCLVNHCVNDILVQGAHPLFFLDYVGIAVLVPEVLAAIVAGAAAGCRENGCALIGGETAQLPGIYTPPDYDLAGFIVGCVDEDAILGSHRVQQGDVLIGLASNGLHTNGYSLARRIVRERLKLGPNDPFPGESGSAADTLLAVHRSYLAALREVLPLVHAMAHITGGGLPGNLNRALPPHLDAVVESLSWTIPNLFVQLEQAGNVARAEMYRTFNMGVGMVVIAPEEHGDAVVASASRAGVSAWRLGAITSGSGSVVIT